MIETLEDFWWVEEGRKPAPDGTRKIRKDGALWIKTGDKWVKHKKGEMVNKPERRAGTASLRAKSHDPFKDYDGSKVPYAKDEPVGVSALRSKPKTKPEARGGVYSLFSKKKK